MNSENKRLPYEMPASYFENSAHRFLEGAKASRSKEDPVLDFDISRDTPYLVPQDYFHEFPTALLQEISSLSTSESSLKSLPTKNAQRVPDGYFSGFAASVMDKINHTEEELDTDTSFLQPVGQAMPFQTPPDYFNQLPDVISAKSKSLPETHGSVAKTTLKVNRYRQTGKWATTLAAACVLMIFALGAVWMLKPVDNEINSKQLAFKMLNSVSDEDIEKYIENELENFDIYSLMDNASASNVSGNNSKLILDAETLLDDISSEDIDAYLIYEGI